MTWILKQFWGRAEAVFVRRRTAWLLLAAPLALVRMRAAAARKRALREYARQRSAAKPAFF